MSESADRPELKPYRGDNVPLVTARGVIIPSRLDLPPVRQKLLKGLFAQLNMGKRILEDAEEEVAEARHRVAYFEEQIKAFDRGETPRLGDSERPLRT